MDVKIFYSSEKVADSKIFRYVWKCLTLRIANEKHAQKTAHVFIIILKRSDKIFFIARLQQVNPGLSGCLGNELVNSEACFDRYMIVST